MTDTQDYNGIESRSQPTTPTVNGTVASTVTNNNAGPPTNPLPTPTHVLLLSLQSPPWFETEYEDLIRAFPSASDTVLKAEHHEGALEMFSYPDVAETFEVVLITDHGIAYEQHSPIWHALLDNYMRKGGKVIMCCGFAYGVNPRDFDAMLAHVEGLDWQVAGCSRSEFMKEEPPSHVKDSLPDSYDWNAVTLKAEGMQPGESWFSNEDGESAASMARVGDDWLGYVGSVNADEGATRVALGMCGLLEEAAV